MGIVFYPSDATQWQQIYTNLFKQQSLNGYQSLPIPPQTLPVLAEHRILAVVAESQMAKSTWRYGGSITAIVDCGAAEFGLADVQRYPLSLNKVKLCILPDFASSYRLRYECPWWFEEIDLTIYQYIGSVTDSTENLILEVQQQLNQPTP
jgi:hypothetical protein